MFCVKCGKKVQEGDRFCWNCGAEIGMIEDVEEVSESPREQIVEQSDFQQSDSVKNDLAADTVYDYKELPTKEETGIRSIYIIDFMLRMTGKSNIPLFIYLILNVGIIGVIASFLFTLPIGWGILAGLLIYIASISIALSPIGEAILRHQTGCYKIVDQAVIDRLEPLFREVYYKAKKENPMISNDVRLFINDEKCPNAFATGRKTVCVTRGLLSMSDEQIKATLGHEFGHLSHKDTDRILVVSIGNTVITAICILFQIGVLITDFIMQIVALMTGSDEGIFISLMSSISRFLTLVVIQGFMKLWTALGVALCMKTSRGNEFLADEFSVTLGYADGLIALLASIGGEKPKGLFANLASSHPHSDDRIARIQSIRNAKATKAIAEAQ